MQCAIAVSRTASTKTPSHSSEREGEADRVQTESIPSRARRELRVATVETAEPDAAGRDGERGSCHVTSIERVPPGASGYLRLAGAMHSVNESVQTLHARPRLCALWATFA